MSAELAPFFRRPLMVHVTVVVRMTMMVVMVVMMFVIGTAHPQAQKHAYRKHCHKNSGQQGQPRLCLLGNHVLTEQKGDNRQNPNNYGVPDRRRETKQCSLSGCPANTNDVSGH
jgi:hypothetical protein